MIADYERAIRLYTRFGFVEEGRRVKTTLVDGVFKDSLLMARLRF